jgi:hypothetical protein
VAECVFDTSFIYLANGLLEGARAGNLLHRRLVAIRQVVDGRSRPRYNKRLLYEYHEKIREYRNDVVELFIALLDSDKAIYVGRSTLRSADRSRAAECRWPAHDDHLLAAAVGGTAVVIYVTENVHGTCGAMIKRKFGITICRVA